MYTSESEIKPNSACTAKRKCSNFESTLTPHTANIPTKKEGEIPNGKCRISEFNLLDIYLTVHDGFAHPPSIHFVEDE